jgi:hypothetical protein
MMGDYTNYSDARAEAQRLANADGRDRGLEFNKLFKTYQIVGLPETQNRFGFELRCEVVSCENYDLCKPGHGPKSKEGRGR